MKIACVYHSIDLDGWMSAAIVKHWFISTNEHYVIGNGDSITDKNSLGIPNNRLDFIGYNYGQPLPGLADYDRVILVDISFPKEIMLELNLRLGINLIWIDHHQRTVNEVNAYLIEYGKPMEGLVTEDGELKAACELTWEYFFSNIIDKFGEPKELKPMPEIVRLLGRYDCFGYMGTPEEKKVIEFQYGARQWITNYEEAYNHLMQCTRVKESEYWFLQAQVVVGEIHENGKSIYAYLCAEAKQTYSNGFEIELFEPVVDPKTSSESTGHMVSRRFLCVNKDRFNAITFGIDYHADGYDGQACFHRMANGKWTFSLYSQTIDCSLIAKQFGGGGHAGAAGFIVDDISKILK